MDKLKQPTNPVSSLDQTDESSPTQLAQQAVGLAAQLLTAAQAQQTSEEKRQAAKIAGMMDDPMGKLMTMALSDQAFRSHSPARINDQILHLIEGYGVPAYFADWEQVALDLGTRIGQYIPHLVVPFVVAKLRAETHNVILPGEEGALRDYLAQRRSEGIRLNLNHLGEAILGEEEAERRLHAYLQLLERPDVEYISVKISSIFSQINLVAFDQTSEEINQRLRVLYRTAMQHSYTRTDGTTVPKFVNLDMEEYSDLHLTVASFKAVLDEPEFLPHKAGIVLQAYLPDSHMVQQELTDWAQRRVARGGAPIKIRIVKGANLAMERVEAALHGWEHAPYYTKADVDANYKRMVLWGCRPEYAKAVNLGIATHNLFDVAFGLIVRAAYRVEEEVEFEMLEGMANHQARVVQQKADGLLLYAPVVKQDDFHSAIAYLVRRLDENTAEENFLHDLFSIEVGNATWERQKEFFLTAVERRDEAPTSPNRRQNRRTEEQPFDPTAPFGNEPDTDFSLPANQLWAKEVLAQWKEMAIADVPLQIGGNLVVTERAGIAQDPSRTNRGYQYALANLKQIDMALTAAVAAQTLWQGHSIDARKRLLVKVAESLAVRRGDLIGAAIGDGGKTITQADTEVSEAIDFANYYARAFDPMESDLVTDSFQPYGTVLVTPPWNFPIAIPAGGMLAALMAGNTVILKPAPETVLVAWHLVNAFWDAGIPRQVLQFVPTSDDEVGQSLVTDKRVDAVILTGGYETARLFLSWKPELRLLAETSGKNSMIISALADHDQAINDLVYSAFGHNGQKCSAASLAVLEAEVYDNPVFRRQLRDAVASLPVGSAWDPTSQITPLIRPPSGALHQTQTALEPGEEWLLEPHMIDGNPNLWSPGIKLGVQPGSFYHKTECFGPILGLMRADNLEHAIDIVNDSDFGLTSGLHSLDDREIARWRDRIEVGNAYINRATTGAIVQRQPFGGWKRSAFGLGAKAGGPNYVFSLGTWKDSHAGQASPTLLEQSLASYQAAWADHFSQEHDPSHILGESNVFRYRPIHSIGIRMDANAPRTHLLQAKAAAEICGVPVSISLPTEMEIPAELVDAQVTQESESELADRIETFERLRHMGKPSTELLMAAHEQHVSIISEPVTTIGRLELRFYLREQSVTETLHRYGNIIKKPSKP
ncbi:bifunctional proline dehydrogenase/L-glutamate gamma-semialdehyde dehydrogenase [Chloroflexi bacterium TSY]|nr:bifunctional proline dehydrogenase/L-glutamate gamma-semialdehyde dehydrogenase [Chloroflexi bacterium TSY]